MNQVNIHALEQNSKKNLVETLGISLQEYDILLKRVYQLEAALELVLVEEAENIKLSTKYYIEEVIDEK